jgi:hypothetical protein
MKTPSPFESQPTGTPAVDGEQAAATRVRNKRLWVLALGTAALWK